MAKKKGDVVYNMAVGCDGMIGPSCGVA